MVEDINKLVHQKGADDMDCVYPFTQETIDNMPVTSLVNPRPGNPHGIQPDANFDVEASTYEVHRVVHEVKQGIFPFWVMDKYYPFKEKWGQFPREIPEALALEGLSFDNPQGLANVVHMDRPSQAPLAYLEWLTNPKHGQNANLRSKAKKWKSFIETVPEMEHKVTGGILEGLNVAFDIKYEYGAVRAEEVFEFMSGGKVPGEVMTFYPEGCPKHCSFIAGHTGAVIGGVKPVLRDIDVSYTQEKAGLDIMFMWAMFRMFAGVHHADDQLGGFVALLDHKYLKKDLIKRFKLKK